MYFHVHLGYCKWLMLIAAVLIGTARSDDDPQFSECSHPYICDPMLGDVWYPFWGKNRPQYCGVQPFKLECHTDTDNSTYSTIDVKNVTYRVLEIAQAAYTMNLARNDLWEKGACVDVEQRVNTSLSGTPFDYVTSSLGNLTLFYGCNDPSPSLKLPNKMPCRDKDGDLETSFYLTGEMRELPEGTVCDDASVEVPILMDSLMEQDPLRRGFIVEYPVNRSCLGCITSGGTCGSTNSTPSEFLCFCSHKPYPQVCPAAGTSSDFLCFCKHRPYFRKCPGNALYAWKFKLVIGVTSAAIAIFFSCVIMVCIRKGTSPITSMVFPRKLAKQDHNVEAFIRNHGLLAPLRHSYSQVKRITNSFKDKLGEGGFGAVYKGKLQNGHLVAVKVLKSSKGNGEEFINEIASISRTSHVNIVSLLGYCFEGHKKALIYEFMPNGSLEKFIFSNDTTVAPSFHLDWEKLYQIATGIARGLEYLHRGCNTRILHFDIKPHNILLDQDFCPKIADFGLAKLCLGKESVVSMLGARGTIGYIAPELCCRNFGGVSHKSDVYSYGMMILEMVGGRKNLQVGVSNTSEIYFPDWIYNQLEQGKDVELHGIITGEDNAVAKKMILVGLWCIQTNPFNRPSMSKVIEMLEGSTGTLQIPPKPYLSSPIRAPIDSSIASSQETCISVL